MGRPGQCCGDKETCGCTRCIKDLVIDDYEYAFVVIVPIYYNYGPTYLNNYYLGELDNSNMVPLSNKVYIYHTDISIVNEIDLYIANRVGYKPKCPIGRTGESWSIASLYNNFQIFNPTSDMYTKYERIFKQIDKEPFTYSNFKVKTGQLGGGFTPFMQMAMDNPTLNSIGGNSIRINESSLVRMNKKTKELCLVHSGQINGNYGNQLGITLGDGFASTIYDLSNGYQPFCTNCKDVKYKGIAIEVSGIEDIQYLVNYNESFTDGKYKPYITNVMIGGCSNFNNTYIINFPTEVGDGSLGGGTFSGMFPQNDYLYQYNNGYIRYGYQGLSMSRPVPSVSVGYSYPRWDHTEVFSNFAEVHNVLCHTDPFVFELYNSGEPGGSTDTFQYYNGGSMVYEQGRIATPRKKATIKIYGLT